jgi:hypothetical protein
VSSSDAAALLDRMFRFPCPMPRSFVKIDSHLSVGRSLDMASKDVLVFCGVLQPQMND